MAQMSIPLASLALGAALFPITALASPAAQSTAAPAWRPMASLPLPSEGMTALRLSDNSVLAIGGDAVTGARTSMAARFTLGARSWGRMPNAPVPLATPAALELDAQRVLVVAPSFANGTIASPSKALLLDPLSGVWRALPDCPVPLYDPRLLHLGAGTVFAAGGVGSTVGATLDLASLRWMIVRSPVPAISTYAVAPIAGSAELLVAGVAVDRHQHPYAVRRAFTFGASRLWHEVARPPVAMDGARAISLDDGRVLLASGYPIGDDPTRLAPPAMTYDPRTDRWTVVGSTGQDHRGAQLLALSGGRGLLIGGHGADGRPSAGSLLFDGHAWRTMRALPGPWSGYALAALADGSVLLIGGNRPTADGFAPVADTMLLPLGAPQG